MAPWVSYLPAVPIDGLNMYRQHPSQILPEGSKILRGYRHHKQIPKYLDMRCRSQLDK